MKPLRYSWCPTCCGLPHNREALGELLPADAPLHTASPQCAGMHRQCPYLGNRNYRRCSHYRVTALTACIPITVLVVADRIAASHRLAPWLDYRVCGVVITGVVNYVTGLSDVLGNLVVYRFTGARFYRACAI